MGRKDARTVAMQCMYQMDMHDKYTQQQLVRCIDNAKLNKSDSKFASDIGNAFISNKTDVDAAIQRHLKDDWKLDRISKIELAILRLSITEMLYIDDVPESVSINEAVELSKRFSDDGSSSFVNGLLGSWVRNES